jgi:hypothetical protein
MVKNLERKKIDYLLFKSEESLEHIVLDEKLKMMKFGDKDKVEKTTEFFDRLKLFVSRNI